MDAMLPLKQQTLFDQALAQDESDSMFAFLDQMVPAQLEPSANPMLYGAAANLGDAALAGAVGDPLAWGGLASAQSWDIALAAQQPQPVGGGQQPLHAVKEEDDLREQPSNSGSGERSNGSADAGTTPRDGVASSKRGESNSLRSKAERLHLAREKACPHHVRRGHLCLLNAACKQRLLIAAALQGNKADKVFGCHAALRLMPHLCLCCAEQGGAEGIPTAAEGTDVPFIATWLAACHR